MKVIGLGLNTSNKRGYTEITYVDDQDFELCRDYSWHNVNGYAGTNININGKKISMHRLIMNVTDPKIKVDHIDRNPLNNTRTNLRTCTHSQNLKNRGPQSNSKSGVKGVSWDKKGNNWVARIKYNNEYCYLIITKDKELAAKTYSYFDRLLCGEFHSNHPYYDPDFTPTKLTPKGLELLEELTNG